MTQPIPFSSPPIARNRSGAAVSRAGVLLLTGAAAGLDERARGRWWLALALAVYVGLRLSILHTNFDAVAMPVYELGTIGNLTTILVEDRGGAPLAQHFDNVGGHLVVGWLAVPFFALLGKSYLALKLVPLLLGVGTLLLIWRLLERHFDRRAALVAVFLFALAPPTLLKYSVIAKGNHFENLFFQLLFLNALFDLHAGELRRRALFLTGLAAGFAVFVYTGALLTVASALCVHAAARGLRRSLRDAAWSAPGFAAGVLPLLWLDLASDGRERQFLSTRFVDNSAPTLAELARRWTSFWTDVLPPSPCFEDLGDLPGSLANAMLLAAFALAWFAVAHAVVSARRERDFHALSPAIWLVHLPAMSFMAAAFDFPFKAYLPPVEVGQYRYLVPHFAFATILIGIGTSMLWNARSQVQRWCARALGTTALATGAFVLPLVHLRGTLSGAGLRYEGLWFEYYSNVLMRDRPWDGARFEAQIAGFDPLYQHRTLQGVGFLMTWDADTGAQTRERADDPGFARIVAGFRPEHAIDVAHGAGSYLRRFCEEGESGLELLRRRLAALDPQRDVFAPYVVEGLALDHKYPTAVSVRSFLERGTALAPCIPPALQPAFQRGFGIACGRTLPRGLAVDIELVAKYSAAAPEALLGEFAFGLGWGAAESTSRGDRVAALQAIVTPPFARVVWEGYGASLRHNRGKHVLALDPRLSESERAAVERGHAWVDYPRAFVIAN